MTERQTGGQKDRLTDRVTDRDGQTGRKTDRLFDLVIKTKVVQNVNRMSKSQTADKKIDRPPGRQTERNKDTK